MSSWKSFWLSLALFLPLVVIGQDHGLWRYQEWRDVEVGREMFVAGNWAVPFLNGEVFLEKPPLLFASVAAIFKLFGRVSANLARIPSTLFALLGILSTVALGRRIGGSRMGLWAGLILATGALYFEQSHMCSMDVALGAWVGLTLLSFFRVYQKAKDRYSFLEVFPIYFFAVLAFYTKAFIGLVIPALAILMFLVWMGDVRAVGRLRLGFGALLFLVLTAPWFAELLRQGGLAYWKIVFLDNHLYRFFQTTQSDLGHHTRWYWYFQIIWKFFSPWSLFLVPAGVLFFRPSFRARFSEPGRKLILSWFISGFVFLTLSSTKREVYLIPLLPAAALAVAAWVDDRARAPGPIWEQLFTWALAALILVLSFLLPGYCGFEASAGDPWALAFLPLAVAVSAWGVYNLLHKNGQGFSDRAWAAGWVLALVAVIFYVPIFSYVNDASHFSRRVAEMTRGRQLYALTYYCTEGYMGVYAGQEVTDLAKVKSVAELAKSPEPVYVVMVAQSLKNLKSQPRWVKKRGAELVLLAAEPIGNRMSALWRLVPGSPPDT
jgi:4-amino-4-deoxy-L-arabinose transferase-like glycosyltransferase